jgi:hypothetical protein
MTRLYVVCSLWLIALALLGGAIWFALSGTTVTESMQISPDVVTYPNVNQPCPSNELAYDCQVYQLAPVSTPGKSGPVIFSCTTVWNRWIEKAPAQASDGTTYTAVAYSPTAGYYNEKWYGNIDAVLSTANSACQNAEQGRLHLFWTPLAPAGLLLIVSEFVRRSSSV